MRKKCAELWKSFKKKISEFFSSPPDEESKEDSSQDESVLEKSVSAEQFAILFHKYYDESLSAEDRTGHNWKDLSHESRLKFINIFEKVLENIYDATFDIEEEYEEVTSKLNLEPVKSFFDEYVGEIITGFTPFGDDIKDIENSICPSVIESSSIKGNALYVKISKLNGTKKGFLKLEPSKNGEFAERFPDDEGMWASRFRVSLYGGLSIEYLDSQLEGSILFVDNQKENI